MIYKLFIILFTIITFSACEQVTDNQTDNNNFSSSDEWLIPRNEVFDGGPGKDGIPALTNPLMISGNSAAFLKDEDLVIIININNEFRVYPHLILDWHEIINDEIGGNKFAITYCPLTGSGIAYNRIIKGDETTFGVSGLLYNTNLIAYDRRTNSNWSQMKMQSVNGTLIGENVDLYDIIETNWKTIKNAYSEFKVVSTSTGYSRSYGVYPYGDYKTNHNLLIFPVSNNDTRLPRKERVLGVIINQEKKAFRFNSIDEGFILEKDNIGGININIVKSKKNNFIHAYSSILEDGKVVNLDLISEEFPLILKDNNNNKYDIFGQIIAGNDKGKRLKPITQYISYWFAWAAFYPETNLD